MKKLLPLSLLLVLIVSFLPLLFQMGAANVQPTEDLWIQRSVSFMTELRRGNLKATYQQYHPGVTVMWPVAAGSWFFYNIVHKGIEPAPNIFSPQFFEDYNYYAKLPLMIVLAGLLVLSFFLLRRIVGPRVALVSTFLLGLDPFYLANARTIHLDAMLTMTMFVSVLWLYLNLNCPKELKGQLKDYKGMIYTGVFFGLSWLSKVVTLFLIPFAGLWLLLTKISWGNKVKLMLIYLLIGLFIFTLLFPAMWVAPFNTLVQKVLYEGIFDTGIEDVSRGLWLSGNSGIFYHIFGYPLTILYRLTPLMSIGLAGLLAQIIFFRRTDPVNKRVFWYFLSFSFFYLLMMSLSTKKIYRYVLPVWPTLAIFAGMGWAFLVKVLEENRVRLKGMVFPALITLITLMMSVTVIKAPSHLFAYFNPFLGGIKGAATVIDLNQDATGYLQVAEYLNAKPEASTLTVACFDWKILALMFEGKTLSIRREAKPITADYILLPIQWGQEWLTADYELERNFVVNGIDYWFLYKRNNSST